MKDQYVIACVDSAPAAATVLPWARLFAERLNHKGLMALHAATGADGRWLHGLGVPYASLHTDWRTAIAGLPTALGGILAVAAYDPEAPRSAFAHPAALLRHFALCRTAYLLVPMHSSPAPPAHVALTLTHRRESKEKLVWASYMARFLGAHISLAHPGYRDEGLRLGWQNNMRFADKLFGPLHIAPSAPALPPPPLLRAHRPDLDALDHLRPDLLIARTSDPREHGLLDLLHPLPELLLLRHPSRTPLLLLNPRDDLYILCD